MVIYVRFFFFKEKLRHQSTYAAISLQFLHQ